MSYTNPNVQDFKDYFYRDFPYGTDLNNNVVDADIAKAMFQASITINQSLFPVGQEQYNIGYYNLSANIMCQNFAQSSQGIGSQNDWMVNAKAVGNVSSSYTIPQEILDNPLYSFYTQNRYGLAYLMMVWPYLKGVSFVVRGRTLP